MGKPAQAGDLPCALDEASGVVIAPDGEGAEAGTPGAGEFFERTKRGGFIAGAGHVVAGKKDDVGLGSGQGIEQPVMVGGLRIEAFDVGIGEVENPEAFEFGRNRGVAEVEGLDGGWGPGGAERPLWAWIQPDMRRKVSGKGLGVGSV